jgi:hypothetical protein
VADLSKLARYSTGIALTLGFSIQSLAAAGDVVDLKGSIGYEYNSNIFEIAANDPLLVAQGDLTRADRVGTGLVGIKVNELFGAQKLTLNLEGREYTYDHYSRLDHSEYLGDLTFAWVLGSRFDGTFDVNRSHALAPFRERESIQLEVDTNQDEAVSLNYKLPSYFRIETSFLDHEAETPLQGFPNAKIVETTERVALRYTGFSNSSYGLEFRLLEGHFDNNIIPTNYREPSVDFVFTYGLGAFSSLNGSVGYSDRKDSATDSNSSAITGLIGFSRQLTGKTSINATLQRAINVFVVGGGSEIDTTIGAGASWAATALITVKAGVGHTHSAFGQQASSDAGDSGRSDQYSSVNLEADYQFLRWLSFRPYARYETRHSSEAGFNYNGTAVGIQMTGQY